MNRGLLALFITAGGIAAAFFIYNQVQKQRGLKAFPEGGLKWSPEEEGGGFGPYAEEIYKEYPLLRHPELIFRGKNQLPC